MTLGKFKYYLLRVILFCFVVGGIAAIINRLSLYYLESDIRIPIYMVCAVIIYPAVVVVLYGSILYVVLFLIARFKKKRKVEYIIKCRENYFKGITPANSDCYDLPDYKELIEIGNEHVAKLGIDGFAGYFQEGQYFINLWTAHIIVDGTKANEAQNAACIEIIKRYADGSLDLKVRQEEKTWLIVNGY